METYKGAIEHCMGLVLQNEPELHATIQLLPRKLRAPVFILRAFAIELSLVSQHATTAKYALIRFQWWKDTIDGIYSGQDCVQPTVRALEVVVAEYDLTREHFLRMIRAWELVAAQQPNHLMEFAAFADDATTPFLALCLECAGAKGEAPELTKHLGTGMGMVTMIRKAPFHASKKQCFLPLQILAHKHLTNTDLFAYNGETRQELRDAIFMIACVAQDHFVQARKLPRPSKAARSVFTLSTPSARYLKFLQLYKFDAFDQRLVANELPNPLMFRALLLKNKLLGTF